MKQARQRDPVSTQPVETPITVTTYIIRAVASLGDKKAEDVGTKVVEANRRDR